MRSHVRQIFRGRSGYPGMDSSQRATLRSVLVAFNQQFAQSIVLFVELGHPLVNEVSRAKRSLLIVVLCLFGFWGVRRSSPFQSLNLSPKCGHPLRITRRPFDFFCHRHTPSTSKTHIAGPKWLSRVCIVVISTPKLNRDVSRRQVLLDKQARYHRTILVAPFRALSARSASTTAQSIPPLIV